MKLRDWWMANKDPIIRQKLASESGTTFSYLQKLAYSKTSPSTELLKKLFPASQIVTPDKLILPEDERPDLAELFVRDDAGLDLFPSQKGRAA